MNPDVIRIGKVNDIKEEERLVRVFFEDVSIMSGWLKVIQSTPSIPNEKTGAASGGTGEASFSAHDHSVTIVPWLPKIGDVVLCLYDTSFNGDGYVLGAL